MSYSLFIFDLDGVLVESWIQNFAQGDFTWLSRKIPLVKHMFLDGAELAERIVGIPPTIKKDIGAWIDENVQRTGILTDRSLFGVEKILLNDSKKDWLNHLAFIQVRESVLNKHMKKPTRQNFFISSHVKPHPKILENLTKTTSHPENVLIVDDNAEFLKIANTSPFCFGTLPISQGTEILNTALNTKLVRTS